MSCLLPGGLVDDEGTVHRELELRALSGREEELLTPSGGTGSASVVTEVLSRCVRRIGALAPVDAATVRRLLVADRQFILLKLREATFGERIRGSVGCPWPDCGKRVAINFSTRDIPVEPSEDKRPVHTLVLSPEAMPDQDEAGRTVTFRLPNGGDQEALSPLLGQNEASALTGLLARCVLGVGSGAGTDAVSRLSARARWEIEQRMAAAAPHVDLLMEATCVECQRDFSVPFDVQRFFFGELRLTGDRLYREVHYLAYHYHWSEEEIMAMTHDRRHRYIEILSDEIERLNESA